jgi:vanadium chloroperoxidase
MTDSILFWNDVALEANRVSHTDGSKEQNGPPLSSRALAIVHLAMYDAYVAIDSNAGKAYLPHLPKPPYGAAAQAAVAGAAHATLSALFPSQKSYFDSKLAKAGDTRNAGHDFGRHVARAILEDRSGDPGVGDSGYIPLLERGRHRVDPDNPTQGFHGPFYGARSKGFAITKRHELKPPPFENTPYIRPYIRALRQVRGKGIEPELMGTLPKDLAKRTSAETLIGIYWGYDGSAGLGTPPRLYNQIIRRLAVHCHNTEARNARLFVLVNVAMADAAILTWDQKYIHDFWRPVIGIREHDRSMGLARRSANRISHDTDPGWLPLGAPATNSMNQNFVPYAASSFPCNQAVVGRMKNFTPNFPSYPSGHATFGAAAFHITRLFYEVPYGNRSEDSLFDGLAFVSDEFNGVNQDNRGTIRPRHLRSFPGGLWQMIEENARSRVLLGVHWIFDSFMVDRKGNMDLSYNIGGVPLGLTIAEDIYKNGMKKSTVGPRRAV